MEKYCHDLCKKDMASVKTLVCVKQVKQETSEEWDESMPLPGNIIEAFPADDADELFLPAKAKSELCSQLGKISNQQVEDIWVKVRRGDKTLKLRARVVQEKVSMLQTRFTIRAATDDRHVVVLADLTLEQCTQLQEMSRRVVNVDCRGFTKKGVKYDWKMKVEKYLPDLHSSVISSILIMPLQSEYCIEDTTGRSMAWFSAAVSSGAPIVFVNIQTEQIVISEKSSMTGREVSRCRQQNQTTTLQIVQGIRLWFLPGVAEVSLELIPELGEVRFGMDIRRTDKGFICVYSVTKGSAADCAGLWYLHEEAIVTGYLLVISRLEGKSIMPSNVSSDGLIHCCDHNEIKDTLTSAIDQMDNILLHIMVWPNQIPHSTTTTQPIGVATLLPPKYYCPPRPFDKFSYCENYLHQQNNLDS